MNVLDSRIYRALEVFTNFFLLNVLWLALCMPLVTAFPATAAMFGVVKQWVRGKDSGFFSPFLQQFRANFAQSLWIGIVWTVLGGLLALDLLVVRDMPLVLQLPLFLLLILSGLGYVAASVYLFPVMVTYELSWRTVLKNSFLIALSQPGVTVRCLLLVGFMALVSYYYLFTTVLTGSVTAYLVYARCDQAFRRIETLKGVERGDEPN